MPTPTTRMKTRTRISMDEALYKLTAWLSPAYPVGAFAYSHGLEWAAAAGDVADAASAEAWIADCLAQGAGRTDAILLAQAWRGGDAAELDELARVLAPSAGRLLETAAQGAAFGAVTEAAWGGGEPLAYPVAVGRAAAAHGIPLEATAQMYLGAFAANLVSACVRLVPLGQTEGQRIVAALAPLTGRVAAEALAATLDDIGGCAIRADIASMRHETQATRLFRT